jgi:PPP family 3-phenylpropionic acid transporter
MADTSVDGGRALGLRVSALFAAIFFVAGNHLPYMPLWLAWVGLTPGEIGIITACPLFVRVAVTPAIAFAADRSGDHRRFLVALSWSVVGALFLLAGMRSFWPVLLCSLLVALAWTTIMPLTETIATQGVRTAGLDYGRMRVWGSISFICAALAGGLVVQHASPSAVIWVLVGASLAIVAAAHALPRPAPIASSGSHGPRLRLADALGLLGSRAFLLFLLAAGAVQAAHAAFYTFGTLHWSALGIPAPVAGILWAIGVVAEIFVFTLSDRAIRRVGPASIIAFAAAAAIVRWLAMAFDPPVPALALLQVLHGITFGATHIGAIHFMARFVPEGRVGTAQALYASATSGIILGGATLAAGPLYAAFGARAYIAMAMIAAAGLVAALALAATTRPRPGSPGRPPAAALLRTPTAR